ncbi:MAG: SirA-like protein [Magnetococcales bacterium]|nr:SirA-like protein [Magnetococcales bacterium]
MIHDDWTERYSRQILLSKVGGAGQQRLMRAGVGVIGHNPTAWILLDMLSRAGIGRLGSAAGIHEPPSWFEGMQRHVRAGNRHTRLYKGPATHNPAPLQHWADSWDTVVDTSGATDIRGHLGHYCRSRGKFYHSCWQSGGYGWILSLKPGPQPTRFCPAAPLDTDVQPQTLPPPLDRLIPGWIAAITSGKVLTELYGFVRQESYFLLRIDAQKGQYDARRSGNQPHCPACMDNGREDLSVDGRKDTPFCANEDTIDITGDTCPMTYVRVKLRMETLAMGSRLRVRMAGAEPVENVPMSLKDAGHRILDLVDHGTFYELLVEKLT